MAEGEDQSTSSIQLTSLPADHALYQDAYLTGFLKTDQMEEVYELVIRLFENTVLRMLRNVFLTEEEFNMIGVGTARGRHEIAFMERLLPFYKMISYTAVDPNAGLLQTHKANLRKAEFNPPVDAKYFDGTFRRYLDERADEDVKFHLISGIHSLYHLGQIEESMDQLLATLKENGILLLMVNSEQSVFAKLRKAFPSLDREDVHIVFTNEDVTREAKRRGCDVTEIPIQITKDVTELFDTASDFGNKILDFLTMTSYFRQTAPKALVEEVMEFWRDNISRDESGRCRANFEEYLMVIQKISNESI
ncbi:histamine N-methyltransferase-like [Diadema setosum]|uniref:histamine N-methyltransferase-like n=1 Tax=Diadema setosum TaxID=31175 RepID=UPI003B3B9DD1